MKDFKFTVAGANLTLSLADDGYIRLSLFGMAGIAIPPNRACEMADWIIKATGNEGPRRTFVLGDKCAQGDCDCIFWDSLLVLPRDFPPRCPECDCTVR